MAVSLACVLRAVCLKGDGEITAALERLALLPDHG